MYLMDEFLNQFNGKIGYLAGPMTGYSGFNYGVFASVANDLRKAGLFILNPAEHYGGIDSLPRAIYLRADIPNVLVADYLVMLPGWETSSGANLEVDIALEMGKPIFLFEDNPEWNRWELIRVPRSLRPRPVRQVLDPTREAT